MEGGRRSITTIKVAMMMSIIVVLIIAQLLGVNSFLAIPPSSSRTHPMNNIMALDTTASKAGGVQLVWFTGSADLRVSDHGGLLAATSSLGENAAVVPLFILVRQCTCVADHHTLSDGCMHRSFRSRTNFRNDIIAI